MWEQTSHCSWDRGEERIVKLFCPKLGGTVFRRFNGSATSDHSTLEDAMR